MKEKFLTTNSVALPGTRPQSATPEKTTNSAQLCAGGAFPATTVVHAYFDGAVEPKDILVTLRSQAAAIQQGDMTQVEAMLINQAVALQSMFADLAVRAKRQKSLEGVQCLSQLALRAQAGCRATLQTLAEVKNPRQVAFVKQTNIAQTQQVNNGVPSPAKEKLETHLEVLVGDNHGSEKMDTRATKASGRVDSNLVTLDAVYRTEKPGRKANCLP
ncbi:MAG: hypothetical protein JWP47_364 [Polaromonas sp.]|nr:hypothetical protein [Polaromonas sp.]